MIISFNKKFVNFNNKRLYFNGKESDELKLYDFNYVSDVYKKLTNGDKLALILRHSERNDVIDDETGEKELTDAGILYAKNLGKSLIGGLANTNDISLHSTFYNRTRDTAKYIAIGRGDTNIDIEQEQTGIFLNGSIYVETAPYTGWEDYSLAAYDLPSQFGGVFKDISFVSNNIINYIKNNMSNTLNIFITHDQLLEILTVFITNKQISLKFWNDAVNAGINERRWITYLAGIAIIKKSSGTFEIYPVKSLDKGFQRSYDNIYVPG